MSFIAVTRSYRPQLCTHTPLSYFHCTGWEVKAPSGSWVCSESCQHQETCLGWLAVPSRSGCRALCLHPALAPQLSSCRAGALVGADLQCEHLVGSLADCSVKCWTADCDLYLPCFCCCCKFSSGDSELCGFTQNWTWASAHSLCKKCSAVPLVIVFPLGL